MVTKIIIPTLLLLFTLPSYAARHSLIIPSYYAANCNTITGTWQGFMTDPTDLFYDGGPWPITISFSYKNGKIVGHTSANKVWAKQKIQADCKDGIITKLSTEKRDQRRHHTPNGALVAKHILMLYLPYENAMIGTNFLVVVNKKDTK